MSALSALSTLTMAIIAGTLLVVALGCLGYGLMSKPRYRDPHDGMARGCLTLIALPLVALLITLVIAAAVPAPTLVRWIFWACVVPAGWVGVMLIAQPIIRWKRRQ